MNSLFVVFCDGTHIFQKKEYKNTEMLKNYVCIKSLLKSYFIKYMR